LERLWNGEAGEGGKAARLDLAAPGLTKPDPRRTVEQMRLVNAVCRFVELADQS
jgi:hypothetical protein